MSPTVEWSHMDSTHHTLDTELASYPPDLIGEAKLRANLGQRTVLEKVCFCLPTFLSRCLFEFMSHSKG
jgi:hypothetical protein